MYITILHRPHHPCASSPISKLANTELTALQTYVTAQLFARLCFLSSSFRRHVCCSLVSQVGYDWDIFALLLIELWLRAESLVELVVSKSLKHHLPLLTATHTVFRQGLLVLAYRLDLLRC